MEKQDYIVEVVTRKTITYAISTKVRVKAFTETQSKFVAEGEAEAMVIATEATEGQIGELESVSYKSTAL